MIFIFLGSLILVVVFIVYVGYPLSLLFFKPTTPKEQNSFDQNTKVYHIIPMYNEEKVVKEKVKNCLEISSKHSITSVFVVDESTDETVQLLKKQSSENDTVIVIDKGYRAGKNDSINLAVATIKPTEKDILLFSDSNTMLEEDSFEHLYDKLILGYGLVGGAMKYYEEVGGTAKSEGLYWKYEEWIRKNESKQGRCVVVNGGNFAMLAKFFKPLPTFVPNDFEAPLRLCGNKIPVGFSYESIGYEAAVLDESEEMSRKQRMANRQMNCITYLWKDIDIQTRFQVSFRKVLRWSGYHMVVLALIFLIVSFLMSSFKNFHLFAITSVFSLSFLISIKILHYFGVKWSLIAAFNHAIEVHRHSFRGMLSSIKGSKVSTWETADSNRK